MIDVTVKNILFYAQAAVPGYTLLLQDSNDESRSLPLVVGQFEAQAIALALEQISLDRPMTHDLLSTIINSLTGGLESVSIYDLKEGTFYAKLNIRNGSSIESIDARPSDAIALALRLRAPIKVAKDVFQEAAVAMPIEGDGTEADSQSVTENVHEITKEAEIRFDLEKDLREAVSREDYEKAALIRDRLHSISES
jgi:hypothetical protein